MTARTVDLPEAQLDNCLVTARNVRAAPGEVQGQFAVRRKLGLRATCLHMRLGGGVMVYILLGVTSSRVFYLDRHRMMLLMIGLFAFGGHLVVGSATGSSACARRSIGRE